MVHGDNECNGVFFTVHEFAQVMGIFVSGPKLQVLKAVLWLMNKDYVWEVSI
jgi:hypothetical protein